MTTTQEYNALKQLIVHLESALRAAQCWSANPPSKKALASQQPFCIDTLSFDQWLQFVLIPKINTLIAQGKALPPESNIAPLAKQVMSQHVEVVETLAAIDALITNGYQ